jgi:hypothetical protein
MVREFIDQAIKNDSGITITYLKDGTKSNVFHLNHVSYSPQYGKNYIVGYCYEYDSELTFKVDRITHAEIEWIDVLKQDNYCSQEGLYITANRRDMCLGFRMKDHKKEEWLNYITDIFHRDDDVLAFHYIPYYSEGGDSKWTPFVHEEKELLKGIYVFAFMMVDGIVPKEDEEYDIVWSDIKHNDIYYCIFNVFPKMSIKDLKIPENINVLAYHYCTFYNEVDHTNHWDLARKMGLIKE